MMNQATASGLAPFTYTGAAADSIVDNGTLTVDNVVGAYDNIAAAENEPFSARARRGPPRGRSLPPPDAPS
jgi:hypothetical protein